MYHNPTLPCLTVSSSDCYISSLQHSCFVTCSFHIDVFPIKAIRLGRKKYFSIKAEKIYSVCIFLYKTLYNQQQRLVKQMVSGHKKFRGPKQNFFSKHPTLCVNRLGMCASYCWYHYLASKHL